MKTLSDMRTDVGATPSSDSTYRSIHQQHSWHAHRHTRAHKEDLRRAPADGICGQDSDEEPGTQRQV